MDRHHNSDTIQLFCNLSFSVFKSEAFIQQKTLSRNPKESEVSHNPIVSASEMSRRKAGQRYLSSQSGQKSKHPG